MRTEKFVKAFQKASRPKTQGYDTQAEVRRVEGGTAWVHIPGGVDETPVKLTIDAKAGDTVQVRVSGGKAFLVGNATAPPTDNTVANEANSKASFASEAIEEQQEHFWYDGLGAHIEGSGTYRNDLKSDGMHIVRVSDSTEVALFGASGAQIGQDESFHTIIDGSGHELYDENGVSRFFVGKPAGNGTLTPVREILPYNYSSVIYTLGHTVDAASGVTVTTRSGTSVNVVSISGKNIKITPVTSDSYIFDYYTSDTIYTYWLGANTQNVYGLESVSESQGQAYGDYSHAEGSGIAAGEYSHASGKGTIALGEYQTVFGRYNDTAYCLKITSSGGGVTYSYLPYLLIIGNGKSDANRSNALTVDRDGNVSAAGQVKSTPTTGSVTITSGIFSSTWLNTQAVAGNMVNISIAGTFTNTSAKSWTTIGTVTNPPAVEQQGCFWGGGTDSGVFRIKTDGTISVTTASGVTQCRFNTSYIMG